MKRPFSLNNEMERTEMVAKIVKLGKENMQITGDWISKSKGYSVYDSYKSTVLICPCCKSHLPCYYLRPYRMDELDEFYYENSYEILVKHIRDMIRLHGDENHMKFIVDYFGKERGAKILEQYCRKNLLVARRIAKFLEELKSLKVDE